MAESSETPERMLPMKKSDVDKLAHQAGGLSAGMMILRINLQTTLDAYGDRMPEPARLRLFEALQIIEQYRDRYDVL